MTKFVGRKKVINLEASVEQGARGTGGGGGAFIMTNPTGPGRLPGRDWNTISAHQSWSNWSKWLDLLPLPIWDKIVSLWANLKYLLCNILLHDNFFVAHNWFNVTNSIIIYLAFDIHDNNQGREGLRGNFHLLSIWGGSWGEGKKFFWGGGVVVAQPKKRRVTQVWLTYILWPKITW